MDQPEFSPTPDPNLPQSVQPGRSPADRSRLALDHPIIVGYDGSSTSRNALAYAVGMARRLMRPLLIVHVRSVTLTNPTHSAQVYGVAGGLAGLERWLLTELDETLDRAGLEIHIRTRRGHPARELATAAAEHSADALVIGAPARHWLRLARSVPGWLARHAHCPVVVVP